MSAFGRITVEGIDLKEFSLFSEDPETTVDHPKTKTVKYLEEFSHLFKEKIIDCSLPIAREKGEGHYIVFSAHSLNVNAYRVKAEKGNIYVEGSFLSFERAYEAFISDFIGYKDGMAHIAERNITSKDNIEGSLSFSSPYNKEELIELFERVTKDRERVISGTHCFKGSHGESLISNASNYTFEKSGKRPAIIELDVGRHSEYYNFNFKGHTICDYDLSAFLSEAAEHVASGGIISICIHMSNPLMNAKDSVWYRGHLGSDELAREMLTEGTELHEKLRHTLKSTFMLAKALSDNGIPFLFRPLHEMNGGWFWWCIKQGGDAKLSRETMKDFWKFFYNVIVNELGIKDSVWVYSPNYANDWCEDVLYAYPGDEYVDIVGCDWYTNGKYEVNDHDSYSRVMSTGKPAALTEVGPAAGGAFAAEDENGKKYYKWTCLDLLSEIKRMIADGFEVSYFLTWTGQMSLAGLGETEAMMNDPMVVDREKLKEYWQNKSL